MSTPEENQIVTTGQETGLSSTAAQLIPFAHHGDYLKLPAAERERVKELLEVMVEVKKDEHGTVSALKTKALQNKGRRGWSFHNLRTLFYAWLDTQDWRVLARGYGHDTSLPALFITHLRAMTLQEHRSRKQAIEKVRTQWRDGKPVPGYGTWREWFAVKWPERDVPVAFAGDYPEGWSNSNLYTYMPEPAQQALATGGYAKAHGMLPHVIRDTGKLRPLEMIVFDDFECDTLCIYQRRVVRVRGVLAIDVATRRKLAVGFKPVLTDDEGVKRSITRADVQFLIKQIFLRYGTPADYPVTLLVENAAAAITEGLEAALHMFFHGQVRVQRTNMLEHRTLSNGFTEYGGKPWEKGWIESAFNLMHNLAGYLPAQKGARYDLAPGTTEERVAYCELLLDNDPKKGLCLTDDQVAQLRLPVESFDALQSAYERIFDIMDNRTEHRMQGFDEVHEWTRGPGDAWHAMREIAALPVAEQVGLEVRTRMQSPRERWATLATRCKFVQVPEFFVALLAFTPRRIKVSNRKVTFEHAKVGYTYLDVDGCLKTQREGTELIGYFDETAPGRLYLTDMKGSAVGVLRHNAPADIKDTAAISASAALVKEFFHKNVQGEVRELLAGVNHDLATDRTHNAALVAQFRPDLPAGKRATLSETLADDKLATPPEQRFAVAASVAAGIASAAGEHAEETRRKRPSSRKPKHDLSDITATAAPEDDTPDLSKIT